MKFAKPSTKTRKDKKFHVKKRLLKNYRSTLNLYGFSIQNLYLPVVFEFFWDVLFFFKKRDLERGKLVYFWLFLLRSFWLDIQRFFFCKHQDEDATFFNCKNNIKSPCSFDVVFLFRKRKYCCD